MQAIHSSMPSETRSNRIRRFSMHRVTKTLLVLAVVLSAFTWGGSPAKAKETTGSPGAVYSMTNDATKNTIVIFKRGADGLLTPAGAVPTGGRGSGTIENNANPLILGEQSPNNLNGSVRYLYAVNAGSNSISVFRTTQDGLERVDLEPSGGDHPISVTVHNNLLYVLNGGTTNCMGGTPSITGFTVSPKGRLEPIPGSTRPVSGGSLSGCAQVSFTPDGNVLVVTQRASDKIDTFLVDRGTGLTTGPIVNESNGAGPFGFTFTQRGQLLTTENFGGAPGQGAASSYEVPSTGVLVPISGPVRNNRSDTCWIVNTDDSRYAYVTNFMSGDISSYRVETDGTLVLLNPIAAVIGFGAADQSLSDNSQYLYARQVTDGTIHAFRVENDGTLTPLQVVKDGGEVLKGIGIAAK